LPEGYICTTVTKAKLRRFEGKQQALREYEIFVIFAINMENIFKKLIYPKTTNLALKTTF